MGLYGPLADVQMVVNIPCLMEDSKGKTRKLLLKDVN